MCYELYLSTSSLEDLSRYNSEFVHFEHAADLDDWLAGILLHPAKWYIGSQSGCSCTFRYSAEEDTEFREPQEWYPEEDDNIQATTELYRAVAALVHGGYPVDCLVVWSGAEPAAIKTMSVSLKTVSEEAFRLFENWHFVFEA